ncbi:MAG TPA: S41 family peptidase [Planctomycetota bacterium]|nr:hypothetical protein [Planctomycetota bacterium]MDP7245583.1 S41 family peptidase [Planctomycetota bacterium]HJM40344.1 S41 family peptidase [Planctomycetota bacterium]|tara:strand:+ start:21026 stop:24313 length:3288 start_codon:yes stop_codon:yes gene_type:complete
MNRLLWLIPLFSFSLNIGLEAKGGDELFFPRHPSLSPDASQAAFCHQGDIWVASTRDGRAQRLTAHDAYDGQPFWSPDGKWIAFLSNRFGNNDVFILPAEGGTPLRVTWHSESEVLHGWLDNDRLLIGATRMRRYARRGQGAWVAYRDGRTPTLLIDAPMLRPTTWGDGAKVVYERGHGSPKRRAYRGPASSALWIWDAETGEHRELTKFDGNDLDPMFSPTGNTIWFLSDRACKGNEEGRDLGLWRVLAKGGRPELMFHPGGKSIRWANASADGSAIIGELDDGLILVNTVTEKAREFPVYGSFDPSIPEQGEVTISEGASDLAVSPDGESIAFVSRGDVFVLRKHDDIERCARITTHPAPDYSPVWVEEGKALLFVSEREGNAELYRTRPINEDTPFYQSRRFELERLTETDFDEASPALSPNGEFLAWIQGAGKLVVGDSTSLEVQRTLTDGFSAPNFEWAPDSRWLAYSQENDDFNNDVFVTRADEDFEPYNLTRHPDDDTNPHWSPDGRKLSFTSRRQMLDETDVYVAWLQREDSQMTKRERLEAEEAKEEAKKKAEKEKKKEAKKKAAADEESKEEEPKEVDGEAEEDDEKEEEDVDPVEIDFEDLPIRLSRMTRFEGNERALGWNADSDKIYFNASQGTRLTSGSKGSSGFYEVELWNKKTKELDSSTVSSFLLHDKAAFFVKSGKIKELGTKGKEYPFNLSFRESRPTLREEVMKQAWRVLDRMFYDPGFHGHDWSASLEKWRPLAKAASTPEDFEVAINWMLGEMNASHMGFYGEGSTSPAETDRHSTGALGVLWDSTHEGPGRKVLEVVKGLSAHREHSRLHPGDTVLEVNGLPYLSGENWAQAMLGTSGEETELLVRSPDNQERLVLIRPTAWSAVRSALYRRNVELARARVEEASEGKLGYIHIEGMGTGSLLEFERDLFRAGHEKEGLLIDVRENGGGWTTDMVLAMLMVKDHATTIPRGGGKGYPQGRRVFASWDKPVVVLCNENSYSNAEIFSWSIKTLGRGPVVGKKTYGAVISTGGSGLLDGSFVRVPFRGWYVNDKGQTNMELNGCPPDYPVENLPGDFAAGLDRQLEKAIEVGLKL